MKILVPTDFSPPSIVATAFAAHLAKLFEAELIVHHAYYSLADWVTTPANAGMEYPELPSHLEEVKQKLEALEKEYADIRISTRLSFYETIDEVMKDVQNEEVDLIIAGTRGPASPSNQILGSDAKRMIRLASCPVIILRNMPEQLPLRRILFVCDLEMNVEEQLKQLLQIASLSKTEVELGFINTPGNFKTTGETDKRFSALQAQFPDQPFKTHVYNHLRIESGILELAAKREADAMAFVTHSRKGWSRLFFQSLTEKLAVESNIPVICFHLK